MQLSPITLVYDQIANAISAFLKKYTDGKYITKKDMLEDFNKYLVDIYNTANSPQTKLELYELGEPLSSLKMNKFINLFRDDINTCAKQLDFLNARTISLFNLFTEEIEGEKKYSERILSKIKILQMYSSSISNDMVYMGDSFENGDYLDWTKMKVNLNPMINGGFASLRIKDIPNIWKPNKVTINKSNGFIGNNHTAIKKKAAISSVDSASNYEYSFLNSPSASRLLDIVDGNPASYFIYEAISINRLDQVHRSNGEFSYIVDDTTLVDSPKGSLVNWASHDMTKPLVLDLIIESNLSDTANTVMVRPYFESSKIVKITNIYITDSGGKTEDILTGEHYIGLSMENLTKESFENYSLNYAVFSFSERKVKQCRIVMKQEYFQNEEILHTYWKTNYEAANIDASPFYGSVRFNPEKLNIDSNNGITYDRSQISPMLSNPNIFKKDNAFSKNINVAIHSKSGGTNPQLLNTFFNIPIKTVNEVLLADRMSIGIRDISLSRQEYESSAEIISKPYNFDLPIESLMLDIDSNSREIAESGGHIESFISLDMGNQWIQISPVQSGYSYGKSSKSAIPEVLAFNQNISNGFKLPGVQYLNHPTTNINSIEYKIPSQVKSILVKINMVKGVGQLSPQIYSYKLAAKVKPA